MEGYMYIIVWTFLLHTTIVPNLLQLTNANSHRFFDVGGTNISVEEIQHVPKAYNQCYVSVAVHNSSTHKHGLANATVTVLSRRLRPGDTTYTYTGFSEGMTGPSGRVCLLVNCHAEGLIFVEKNSIRIFAASKSDQKLPPKFWFDVVYGNQMVNFRSFVWGTILGHTGPVYTNVEKTICERATMQDYHFVFSYISIPDVLLSTLAPINTTNLYQTDAWRYGFSDSGRRTCYIKVLIKTKSTQLSIRAYSRLNDSSGVVFGLYESGAKYDISSSDITSTCVCLQFRCPAQDMNGIAMNTYVQATITAPNGEPIFCPMCAGGCILDPSTPMTVGNNWAAQQMKFFKQKATNNVKYKINGTSFSATFEDGRSYGPADGIYMAASTQQARSRCFTGHDFLGKEYSMNVNSGYAIEYDCTKDHTDPPYVG